MRIAVVGIGGVGGYYGGKLAQYYNSQSDIEVVFIARTGRTSGANPKTWPQATYN